MSAQLTITGLRGVPLVQPGDDLAAIALAAYAATGLAPEDGDVLVVAQKIVSKAEGRIVDVASVEPSPQAIALAAEVEKDPRLVEVILSESRRIVRHRPNLMIAEHRLGYVMANAGIDHSNVAPDDGTASSACCCCRSTPTPRPKPCAATSPTAPASASRSSSATVSAGRSAAARSASRSAPPVCRR